MSERRRHEAGCILDPVHWLRHAVGAANRLLSEEPDDDRDSLDRISAQALLGVVERHAEFSDGWATMTLREVTEQALDTLGPDKFESLCTCKPNPGPVTAVRL
jgi:hypothetical protein